MTWQTPWSTIGKNHGVEFCGGLHDPHGVEWRETLQKVILDADYSKVDIDEVVDKLLHISADVQQKLKAVEENPQCV
jgi:hypothetical protein